MDWNGKHVLVTGGAGFIGSHVADAVLAKGARVTVFDDFSTGFREFVPQGEGVRDRVTLVEADLLDARRVLDAMKGVDFVFHMAANADIKDNFAHPRKCVEQNVVVTQNVLEAMRATGTKQIAFASTGSVYGEPKVLPTPEDYAFPTQTSMYASSKVCAEGLLTSYAQAAPAPAFQVWIFRFVSLLGPRYTHGHVVDFYRKLKDDPARLPVLGDGRQKKSYLHVADCVSAMLVAVDRAREPINVFNLGHTDWIEVKESIQVIVKTMGLSPRIEYAGGERGWPGDSPKILLDTKRIQALGWKATRSIEESVVETLRYLDTNAFALKRR
jgi:UDP-glucose 4-epimerase